MRKAKATSELTDGLHGLRTRLREKVRQQDRQGFIAVRAEIHRIEALLPEPATAPLA